MHFRMDIGGLQDAAKARREKLMAMRAKVRLIYYISSASLIGLYKGICTVFLSDKANIWILRTFLTNTMCPLITILITNLHKKSLKCSPYLSPPLSYKRLGKYECNI